MSAIDRPIRIVLTGGPGGGKTSTADMIAREYPGRVVALKETATILFQGGFPRVGGQRAIRACQRAIFKTQAEMEEAVGAERGDRILLCDRGTIDGAAYWPEGPEAFYEALGTTAARELARYDAVLFFESAASGGRELDRLNPFRVETTAEAARLDAALRAVWAAHPRLRVIPHSDSFFKKVGLALETFETLLTEVIAARAAAGELCSGSPRPPATTAM